MKQEYDIKELCTVPPPVGGVTVHCHNLCRRLAIDGYKVGAYSSAEISGIAAEGIVYDKLYWKHSDNFLVCIWRHILRYFHILNTVRPYKIVHSHFGLEEMLTVWSIRHILDKKVVITIHNSMIDEFYANTRFHNRIFMKFLAQSSNVCWICVNSKGKEQLSNLPFKFKNEILVIPPYIPQDGQSTPLSREMTEYISKNDRNIVFYGHSFMTYNGLDVYGFETALNIFSNLSKMGNGISVGMVFCLSEVSEPEKINRLHKKAKELNVDGKIFWQIGAIDNMSELWKASDIYIRPTATDGDSLAVREALDYGVQVIASDVCERPAGVVLYHFGDDDELLHKTKKSLHLGKTSQSPNLEHYYSIKKIYDRLLSI